ncbi:MAG: hypothetical protein LBP29_02195 [Treponema sp.]|jgi:hypothetical protein|nr:hypothetical protein [Treponema sp.]
MKNRVAEAMERVMPEKQHNFRVLLHRFKNLEIEIRKNTEPTIIRELTPFISQLGELIMNAKNVFAENRLSFIPH